MSLPIETPAVAGSESAATPAVAPDVSAGSGSVDSTGASEVVAPPVAPAGTSEAASEAPVSTTPTTPEFDWNAWDGAQPAPEPYRPAIERARALAAKEYEPKVAAEAARREAAERDFEQYRLAFETTGEDPRISELLAKAAQIEAEKAELATKVAAAEARIAAQREAQAREWSQNWLKTNATLLAQPEAKKSVMSLINDGWDPDIAIELQTVGEPAVKMARELRATNPAYPDDAILKIVAATKPKLAKEDVASDAFEATPTIPRASTAGESKVVGLDDYIQRAAQHAAANSKKRGR